MEKESFDELLESARQAAAILRGDAPPSRQFTFTSADVKAIRQRLGLSQRAFAMLLGVSTDTVQNWEQNRRKPRGAARLLLLIAQRHPEVLTEVVEEISPSP